MMLTGQFLANGETSEIYPGGPLVIRTDKSIEVDFGRDRSQGYMLGVLGPESQLVRTQTFNEKGVAVTGTNYGITKGALSGIIETWYDLAERGTPSRWERSEPQPGTTADNPSVVRIVEELDARTGTRREISRVVMSGRQLCTAAEDATNDAVIDEVNRIVSRFQGSAACPAGTGGNLQFSDAEPHSFAAAAGSPVCVDSNCNYDSQAFGAFINDTIKKGAQCLAQLGMKNQSAAARRQENAALSAIGGGASLSMGNAGFLGRTTALRNSAMLLMLFNQSSNVGAVFDASKQSFFAPYGSGDQNASNYTLGSQAQASRAMSHSMGPLKFFCAKTGYSMVNQQGDSHISRFRTSGLALASANLPGMPGYPMIQMRAGAPGAPRTTFNVTDQALLFHELMHILGWPHQEQNPAAAGMPLHTACQACCFPDGFRGGEIGGDACQAKGAGSIQERMCGICANDAKFSLNAGTADQKAANRARYLSGIRGCWGNGNPL
jgi:hypothetical protein